MFSYILRLHAPTDTQSDEFFRRFKQTPGLHHAYNLQGVEDAEDGVVVTIWDSRDAAEAYLQKSELRKDVDKAYPAITRTMYNVRDSK
ncbi:antibiotic biosynthesis monooxygenase family protein [Devosia sp.]|uniref:antibiotic biosynthesis monooxygenase family protein n=1 Tax=Devosia sp. TaxID=1871048 RepID=UPI002FC9FAA6